MKKRTIATLLFAAMTLSMLPGAAKAEEVQQLPEAPTYEIDNDNQLKQYYTGYCNWDFTVEETARSCKIYCPADARRDAEPIYLAVPNGVDTVEFMQNSGWAEVADQNGQLLIAMEPIDGEWGEEDAELAYMHMVYNRAASGAYFRCGYDWRFVGYGEGGTLLQKYVMNHPISAASLVVIDGSEDISQEYLDQMATLSYDDTYGTSFYSEALVSEIPVPVWIISSTVTEGTQAVVDYWCHANECTEESTTLEDGTVVYTQDPDSTSPYTYDEKVGTVRVTEQAVDYADASIAAGLYAEFTGRFDRTGTGSPYSSTLKYTVSADLFQQETLQADGITREWFTYLPTSYDGSEEVPLVIYIHGGSQSGLLAAKWSDWHKTAEAEGFIVVYPSGALVDKNSANQTPAMDWNNATRLKNDNDDLAFVKAMLAELQEEYNIDPSRIYITGHAMTGAPMVTYLGLQMPEVFAAGACSGSMAFTEETTSENLPEGSNEEILFPLWTIFGEHDLEAYPEFLLKYFTNRYGIDYEEGKETSTSTNAYTEAITYTDETWSLESGVPMVKFTYVSKRAHSFRPEETALMWNWLSQWTKTEGVLSFNGEVVE